MISKEMTKEQFNEWALYCFMIDVNEFGAEVAAEILIRSIKAWVKSTGKEI